MRNSFKIHLLLLCLVLLPTTLWAQNTKIKPADLIGTWLFTDTANHRRSDAAFVFNKDNSFVQADGDKKRIGTWEINVKERTLTIKSTESNKTETVIIESLTSDEFRIINDGTKKNTIIMKRLKGAALEAYLKTAQKPMQKNDLQQKAEVAEVRKTPVEHSLEAPKLASIATSELSADLPILGTWITTTNDETKVVLMLLADNSFMQTINDKPRKGTWTIAKDSKVIQFMFDDKQSASFEVIDIGDSEMQCKEILTQFISIWKKQL